MDKMTLKTLKDIETENEMLAESNRCGAEILEVGYPTDFVQYYKCANPKCMWGKK